MVKYLKPIEIDKSLDIVISGNIWHKPTLFI